MGFHLNIDKNVLEIKMTYVWKLMRVQTFILMRQTKDCLVLSMTDFVWKYYGKTKTLNARGMDI